MDSVRRTNSKLVRDNIPSIIKESGKKPIVRIASEQEMIDLLKEKLSEECLEVRKAYSKKMLKEELGDVLEVLISLAETKDISWEEIVNKKDKKAEKRGRFTKRYVLEEVI
jgi:predicted house-cleaning noncanonical NTP pyrophosphatase (MazG superfamily)